MTVNLVPPSYWLCLSWPESPGCTIGEFLGVVSPMPVWTCRGCCWLLQLPYCGIFLRENFSENRRYVRPNGNFGGKIFTVPLKQRHTYLTHAMLSSIVWVCFENKGIMSVSYTLESMILSNLSLLFSSAVNWSYAPAPAFLSLSSPVVWLYWQLHCWKPVPALIVSHRAVVVPTPRAGNTCIVPSFKVDFAPALVLNRSRADN